MISEDDFQKINQRSEVHQWDLLFSMIGTVGEVGVVYDKPDFAIKNVGLIKANDRTLSKFLYYYLTSNMAKKYVDNNKSQGTQPFLALGKLRKFPIPIPSLSKQQEIVAILDKFDTLTQSISTGLPREIELRQKQYQYYRNLLLSFD